jgi:membrane protease YdiL (CAAX protease family)
MTNTHPPGTGLPSARPPGTGQAHGNPTRTGAPSTPASPGRVPGRVPRWGSVAHRRGWGSKLSTASGPAQAADPRAWLVMAGGPLFLLARPALGGATFAVPLLAVGYLVLLAGALAVRRNQGNLPAQAPIGWKVPLLLGLVGVAGAAMVGGPVADRRVGGVAVGLALGAAVAEEALFRRVLYERLLRFGVVAAVVGSAGVFALVHLPAYGVAAMPVDLGAALLLSWQRYASGRWTVPAVTHAVANLLAVT